MENKYIKNLRLSIQNMHLNYVDAITQNAQIGGKWLFYILMITALVLWVIFNIVVIESYSFPHYLLVIMNLILYCIIASMINSDDYSDAKK